MWDSLSGFCHWTKWLTFTSFVCLAQLCSLYGYATIYHFPYWWTIVFIFVPFHNAGKTCNNFGVFVLIIIFQDYNCVISPSLSSPHPSLYNPFLFLKFLTFFLCCWTCVWGGEREWECIFKYINSLLNPYNINCMYVFSGLTICY